MSDPLDLSIIIVSHGHEDMLPSCIGSLLPALEGLTFDIIVVDNLGRGKVSAVLKTVPATVLENTRQLGFAANVNLGARVARGRYLLLLNPDTVHASGSLADAVAFLAARRDIGILGCSLLNADHTPQQSYRQFPSLAVLLARGLGADNWPWRPAFYRRRMMESVVSQAPHAVDWVFGAFMLMRRMDLDRLGGLDEGFRLYYEDVDLCHRFRRDGLATWLFPSLTLVHVHLRHSAKKPFSQHWRWHVASAARYFWKSWRFSEVQRFPVSGQGVHHHESR